MSKKRKLKKIVRKFLFSNINSEETLKKPSCGRVDRASAAEEEDFGLIPGRCKPKTIKIGIHSFPA